MTIYAPGSGNVISANTVTEILARSEAGDLEASADLFPIVYNELRKLAAARLAHEQPGQTLQATALVHETYLRLVGNNDAKKWRSRQHFFAAAAEAMRRILVNNARRKGRIRHGGGFHRQPLADIEDPNTIDAQNLLAIHEALHELESTDRPAAEVVKLHFFAGFTLDEVAAELGVSRATVYRNWAYARAWLQLRLPNAQK